MQPPALNQTSSKDKQEECKTKDTVHNHSSAVCNFSPKHFKEPEQGLFQALLKALLLNSTWQLCLRASGQSRRPAHPIQCETVKQAVIFQHAMQRAFLSLLSHEKCSLMLCEHWLQRLEFYIFADGPESQTC